jgi:hypothetical protein
LFDNTYANRHAQILAALPYCDRSPQPDFHSRHGGGVVSEIVRNTDEAGNAWSGKETLKFGELFCPAAENIAQASFTSYRRMECIPASKLQKVGPDQGV